MTTIQEPIDAMPFNENLMNQIRGKAMLMSPEISNDIQTLCYMLDWFKMKLDETEEQDLLGTEGWRHYFGIGE